ncbi:MAG: LuxR C-terminal-related transcriptional regulator [Christensenellales bacterium]
MLEKLERGNMFITPLDERRQWYRYHQLFADVLHVRAMEGIPGLLDGLHLRASGWYEQNSLRAEAIYHALAARSYERAAELIELAWPAAEERSIPPLSWLAWVKALPDNLICRRPALNVWYAFALLGKGEIEAAHTRLTDALKSLSGAAEDAKQGQYEALQAAISVGLAYVAQAMGNTAESIRYARLALESAAEKDHHRRDQASMLLGMSYWASGNLEAARQVFADHTIRLRAADNIPDTISTAAVLAEICLALGRLGEAFAAAEQCLRFAGRQGRPLPPDAADLHRVLSELHLERGNLAAAAQHLQKGGELGENAQPLVLRYRLCIARAKLSTAQADFEDALECLDEAQRLYTRSPLPDFCPIAAMKAGIWAAQGRLEESLAWVRERNLAVDDEPGCLREYEYITLARILILNCRGGQGDGQIGAVMRLLDRLLLSAQEGGRLRSMVHILIVQAVANLAQGKTTDALAPLARALALAEPEGFVLPFANEGTPMEHLLREALSRAIAPSYVRQLLAAFVTAGAQRSLEGKAMQGEQLSRREIEVLGHIAQGRSNPEIAAKLYLTLNTVKVHTRNIFGKLGVSNRTQAAAKARELGIMTTRETPVKY